MKIVFCLIPEPGHVNPYIGPAQALAAMGHGVVVAAAGDLSAQLRAAGLTFRGDLIPADAPPPPRGKALVDMLENRAAWRAIIEARFLGPVPGEVGPLRAFLAREAPDGVVVDPMYYAAVIAARLESIPWVTMASCLTSALPDGMDSDVLRVIRQIDKPRAALFQSFGFLPEFRAIDCLSPLLNVTFATRDLVGEPPAGVSLVGASRPLGRRGDEVPLRPLPDGKPVVYASFGSQIFHYPAVFEKIEEACRPLGAHLVLSIGDLADEPRWKEPRPERHVYRYAPQLEVLSRASVFVTHGGANSVMEGIGAAVPLLVSPMCNDQEHQARFVERAGLGLVEDLRAASVETIRERLRSLLGAHPARAAVKKASVGYRENGAPLAAKLVAEALARAARPVSPAGR